MREKNKGVYLGGQESEEDQGRIRGKKNHNNIILICLIYNVLYIHIYNKMKYLILSEFFMC